MSPVHPPGGGGQEREPRVVHLTKRCSAGNGEAVPETWMLRRTGGAYAALQRWMQEHGHDSADPPRESYLVHPEQVRDPAELRTEVQWPIR